MQETMTLEALRAELETARAAWGETGAIALATGGAYTAGEPVRILVRKRGRRYDLDDRGAAVRLAGQPRGWLEAADRVVGAEGFNVNRAGVVFVPVVEGRDIAELALRLEEASRAVYGELVELADSEPD